MSLRFLSCRPSSAARLELRRWLLRQQNQQQQQQQQQMCIKKRQEYKSGYKCAIRKRASTKGRQQQIICCHQLVAAPFSVLGREEDILLQKHQSNRCFRGSFVLILIASGHLQEMDRESLDLSSFHSPLSFFPPPLLGVLAQPKWWSFSKETLAARFVVQFLNKMPSIEASRSAVLLLISEDLRSLAHFFTGLAGGTSAIMEATRSRSTSPSATHVKSTLIRSACTQSECSRRLQEPNKLCD